jgi:phosphoketolase
MGDPLILNQAARDQNSHALPKEGESMADKLTYTIADEAKIIATRLIQANHLHLIDEDVPLVCIFKSKGTRYFAKAKKVKGGLIGFLAQQFIKSQDKYRDDDDDVEAFNIIEIIKPLWEQLTATQKDALIDHELCHFAPEGKMRRHDLEEFREVIKRHGFYMPDVKEFAEAVKKREEDEKKEKEEEDEAA